MRRPADRLKETRIARGIATASEAARRIGIAEQTYLAHENGSRGLGRAAPRYAQFYKVSLGWLLTGTGAVQPGQGHPAAEIYDDLPPARQIEALDYLSYLHSRKA
jgi:DNA-binding XRE family transcriptional regulator